MNNNTKNTKTFICKNPNSKFKHILSEDVIKGRRNIGFVFSPVSDNCYYPVVSSLYELMVDGWEEVNE